MADFFNKVLVGLNKGVNSVSENSKLFMEKAKLNSAIKEKEDLKNKTAQQLGMMAYQLQKNGDIEHEQFKDMCAEIEKCNNDIEELNVQLLNLQNAATTQQAEEKKSIQCTCGYYNKSNAVFCASCGSKLNQTEGE